MAIDSQVSTMKKVTIELTPRQALAAASVLAYTRDATPGNEALGAAQKIISALGVNRLNRLPRPFDPTWNSPAVRISDRDFRDGLAYSNFAEPVQFDFSRLGGLPKSVVYFEYPEHGSGQLKPRLIKVEAETPAGLAGYEVDLNTGAMSWTYKNFTKSKIENLQRQ